MLEYALPREVGVLVYDEGCQGNAEPQERNGEMQL